MEQIAPRPSDDVTSSSVNKPSFKSTHNNRSNPALVTVSHITTSAEITKLSPAINKLRIPHHQPLFLNNNRSSMSSLPQGNDSQSTHSLTIAPPLPPPITKQQMIPKKKKSIFASGEEYSELENITRTPPQSNTPIFSPRYANSPPAGSGGKYMMKSKRTSWIVDAGGASASVAETSTPSTPVSLPENIIKTTMTTRSRKSSVVDKRFISVDESSSLSKLRTEKNNRDIIASSEDQQQHNHHHRNVSISSILTDNISMISDDCESSNDTDSTVNNKCKL
jgi:hypothetical protein